MTPEVVQAITRHLLTIIAGGMFARYGVSGDTAEAIIAGFAALAGVGWSIVDKQRRKEP